MLFVANLAWSTQSHGLTAAFAEYGPLQHAAVAVNSAGRSKGFGWVTFATSEAAEAGLKGMDGQMLEGRKIRVQFARRGGCAEPAVTPAPEPARIQLGLIEVVGSPNPAERDGDIVEDEKITEMLQSRSGEDISTPSDRRPRGSGHRWTTSQGVLVTRYTRHRLQCAFQLMGLKQLRARTMADAIFEMTFSALRANLWIPPELPRLPLRSPQKERRAVVGDEESPRPLAEGDPEIVNLVDSAQVVDTTVRISRAHFAGLVRNQLSKNHHRKPKHLVDFEIACAINEHRTSMTILLGGTSGCGKSTLASLLASRLGITTVLSTDFVRHMMRQIHGREQFPVLWASTYNAGATLEHSEGVKPEEMVLRGYDEQSRLLLPRLEALIQSYEDRCESLIIEGVHLTVENIIHLTQTRKSVIPFVVCISNEDKHRERFAVRAKYMTLDGRHNRYIKYFQNIRCIQNSLLRKAQQHLIPQVDNTNVDRSVTAVHDVLVKCMRAVQKGKPLYDVERSQATVLWHYFAKRMKQSWSSKVMLQVIQGKMSKGELFRRFFEEPTPQEEVQDPPTLRFVIPDGSDDAQDDRSAHTASAHGSTRKVQGERSVVGSVGFTATRKDDSDAGDSDTETTSSGSGKSQLSNVVPDEEACSVVNTRFSGIMQHDGLSLASDDELRSDPDTTPAPHSDTDTRKPLDRPS